MSEHSGIAVIDERDREVANDVGTAPPTAPDGGRDAWGRWSDAQIERNRKAVVDALVNGNYEQTSGVLREGAAYCAEGVICDVSGLGEWRSAGSYDGDVDCWHYVIKEDRNYNLVHLPDAVLRWLGEDRQSLTAWYVNKLVNLEELNDCGASLVEIGLGLAQAWELDTPDEWWEKLATELESDAADDDDDDDWYAGV